MTLEEINAFETEFNRAIRMFDAKTIQAIKAAISAERLKLLNGDKPKRTLL